MESSIIWSSPNISYVNAYTLFSFISNILSFYNYLNKSYSKSVIWFFDNIRSSNIEQCYIAYLGKLFSLLTLKLTFLANIGNIGNLEI